jgi:hypothetical protein
MNLCAFSPSRQYRYALFHRWDEEGEPVNAIAWICLRALPGGNETALDKELRQVKKLSEAMGYNAFLALSLFAWVQGDAREWMKARNPVGFENDEIIGKMLAHYPRVIVAWGKVNGYLSRAQTVAKIVQGVKAEMFCVGINLDGSPKQPLKVVGNVSMQPYTLPKA